jgi:uncharacterized membrane protein
MVYFLDVFHLKLCMQFSSFPYLVHPVIRDLMTRKNSSQIGIDRKWYGNFYIYVCVCVWVCMYVYIYIYVVIDVCELKVSL